MKAAELLKTNHDVQANWLKNQLSQTFDNKSFKNIDVAMRAYELMNEAMILNNSDVEHFVHTQLSDSGIKKLVTTLRVSVNRSSKTSLQRLQVELTLTNSRKLDRLAKKSGKTKIQLINRLILEASESEFAKPEEQLDLLK